jgi:glycosyltransferase involved in cell wall biosynthesis
VRVLHVSGGTIYGGIERMLSTFASTRSAGFEQQFAAAPAGRLWHELHEIRATVAALPSPRASRPLTVLKARREFARILARLTPDAAVFHGSWAHAMFAAPARDYGCTVAFWQHAPITQPRWPDRWASWTAPDVLIANSRFTATAPAFPDLTANVIYCPVPAAAPLPALDREQARAALGAAPADVVVLMAARLEAWKGHAILVDAVRLLGNDRVRVWIAGGPQRPEERTYFDSLRDVIASAGCSDRITLLGQRDDVPLLMQFADIYSQPNTAPEPFGIAIAEAMRAGIPCVVSDTGGPAELVDEHSGILTPPGDGGALASALSALAGDAARRREMGNAAAARAARLTDPAQKLEEMTAVLFRQPVHAG